MSAAAALKARRRKIDSEWRREVSTFMRDGQVYTSSVWRKGVWKWCEMIERAVMPTVVIE